MGLNDILTIVFAVLSLVGTFVSFYFKVKSDIIKAANDAINNAEVSNKTGEEKLAIAVAQVLALVPAILKPFLTESVVEKLVQMAFDKIEDYAKKQVAKKNSTK